MKKQLPERPDLGQLKKQAKDLLNEVHANSVEALARAGLKASDTTAITAFALADAQRVLAREYDFASWAKLKLHVETRAEAEAEARLIEAALEKEQEVVATILREHSERAMRSVFAAAVLGHESAVRIALEKQPSIAREAGGPRGWPLLLYVAFGRCGAGDIERARIARALLEEGADPNAGWIHPHWPDSPLPALYGATGVNNFPQLARVLLAAGANPNDGESRYHAAEHHHVASLEVLAEFGCDFSGPDRSWGNTPLYFLLGHTHPSPPVKAGIRWLLEHGANPNVTSRREGVAETTLHRAVELDWDVETVSLLLRYGADVNARAGGGRTAYALAIAGGRAELAGLLAAHGAAVTEVGEADAFLGACMRGDAATARALLKRKPGIVSELGDHERLAAIIAAREGRAEALTVMAEVGLGLDVLGPDGERPLHWAAWYGWAEAVRVLIAHGVGLSEPERRFRAPPSGWCAHGSANCKNPKGDYARVMELLIEAGAFVAPDTSASPPVMAVLRKKGIGTHPAR